MGKKIIIATSAILILSIGYYLIFCRSVDFPNFNYDHVTILSIDRNLSDTASGEFRESILPLNNSGTNGASFLDEKGKPIHSHYIETPMNPEQVEEIHTCLSPPSMSGEISLECVPFYRDIVMYYDKNDTPIAWISICFECTKIYFSPKNISVSNSSIECLESFFKKFKNRK